jgi:hypothetical protein
MAIEFLHGRALEPEELDLIRQQIEEFDQIDHADPEIRAIVRATGRTCWRSCRLKMTNVNEGSGSSQMGGVEIG